MSSIYSTSHNRARKPSGESSLPHFRKTRVRTRMGPGLVTQLRIENEQLPYIELKVITLVKIKVMMRFYSTSHCLVYYTGQDSGCSREAATELALLTHSASRWLVRRPGSVSRVPTWELAQYNSRRVNSASSTYS